MLDILKKVKERQEEAKKIITEAHIEAGKIKEGLLQKSVAANEEGFLAEITQAEKRADEILKNSSSGIDQEISKILSMAEQEAKKIEEKAKANQKEAVNAVLEMIFNRGDQK